MTYYEEKLSLSMPIRAFVLSRVQQLEISIFLTRT